jgi:hypothetical protein
MIALILVGLVLSILFMQFVITPRVAGHLYYGYSFDTELAEPGEKITYSDRLVNNFFLPVSYISLALALPEGAKISEKNRNNDAYRIWLPPFNSSRHTLSFTLPRRGVYRGGRYFMETGDLLGFKSFVKSGKIAANITVMPRKCEDELILQTLGGYIGDISVKRFIIEDPMLTIGFNDYTGREPMKKISWPLSARKSKLVVKNYDYTVDVSVIVVLNLASGSAREKEKCLEITRTACEQLESKHIPYQFLSNGDVNERKEGFGKMHLNAIMTDLGRSELISYSSFDTLIDRCIQKRKNNGSYIIISSPLSESDRISLHKLNKFCDYAPCVLEAEVN